VSEAYAVSFWGGVHNCGGVGVGGGLGGWGSGFVGGGGGVYALSV